MQSTIGPKERQVAEAAVGVTAFFALAFLWPFAIAVGVIAAIFGGLINGILRRLLK